MLFIREFHTNETEGYRYYDSEVYESSFDNIGELFLSLMEEFGRCLGKIYIDQDDESKAIGWCFESRIKYDDCKDTYLRHVWVEVHEKMPVKTIEYFYKGIEK